MPSPQGGQVAFFLASLGLRLAARKLAVRVRFSWVTSNIKTPAFAEVVILVSHMQPGRNTLYDSIVALDSKLEELGLDLGKDGVTYSPERYS